MALKPFPACHFAHASTWAAAEIAAEQRLRPDDIAEIVVRISPAGVQMVLEPLEAKRRPRTAYDAKFSLPFTVAHRLVHGGLGLDAFTDEAIADADVLLLARRVRWEPLRPSDGEVSRFGGGARVVTRSGDSHDRMLPDAPGSPRNPLDEESVLRKFRDNASLVVDAEEARRLAETIRAIAAAPAVHGIMAAASGAAASKARA